MTISAAIDKSIETLYDHYYYQPLLYLRESNLQFRLNQLILDNLIHFNGTNCVSAQIKTNKSGFQHPPSNIVFQSQTELKLKIPNSKPTLKRSDIIVFKSGRNIDLVRKQSGPLDIIAQVEPDDIAAVIELKAAPSANSTIPQRLADDVNKLLYIVNNYPHIEAHFVYFDKTIGVAGHSAPLMPSSSWATSATTFSITSIRPTSGAFAHIWEIDVSNRFCLQFAY